MSLFGSQSNCCNTHTISYRLDTRAVEGRHLNGRNSSLINYYDRIRRRSDKIFFFAVIGSLITANESIKQITGSEIRLRRANREHSYEIPFRRRTYMR